METLHYMLMKTNASLNRRILTEAAALGLSPGQPKILECLMACGECNQKTIAAYCEIEQATVGNILLRMERDGLVRRVQRDGNRRALYVSLTSRGEEISAQMRDIFCQVDAKATSHLSQEEQAQLLELLARIYVSVTGEEMK
jgi:DNA-binding MarR family transcriptional regulator